jgi:Nucleotidyl transferase AbiEii toxin, Type IV TA system
MAVDPPRSRAARAAAEAALVRVVHHYGSRPEFVVLGGLVPELLCANSAFRHAGTTDVDVQVDLEIACGAASSVRLEHALRNAKFEPDSERAWRWVADGTATKTVVKFELLADVDTAPVEAIIRFDEARGLGAVNLRGTGFAARDYAVHELRARIGGVDHVAEVNVSGLAGFLLAKTAAAHSRRKPKDWYDIAFVLLPNEGGGPEAAAAEVRARFGDELVGSIRIVLDDLATNFQSPSTQGPRAYASQILLDHPELDETTVLADAVLAVEGFYAALFDEG